ncbi:hypothetical protein [Streptomyces sp. NPDC012888]|uniref:hypothetical protein n=1 Tax=Streptomyces sp. NPDC012888 TaxID=3364855 RepID=UPI003686FF97
MHIQTAPFTLNAWQGGGKGEPARHGFRGTSPEWGEITVSSLPSPAEDVCAVQVLGGHLPEAVYESRGIQVVIAERPTLNGATLRVGGAHAYLKRNRWAATHRGRALHLKHAGDRYRLWAVNRRSYVLHRAADNEDRGVTVTVREAGFGKRKRAEVTVAGRAVGADIALAVLFTGVDRSALTRRGAVRSGISRVFHVAADSALT